MKKVLLCLMLVPLSGYASYIGDFEAKCIYINSKKVTVFNGKCTYRHEIFKEDDSLAVQVYTTKIKTGEIRALVYPNGAASVNDIPAIAKTKGKQITITTGEGEVFVFDGD